MSGSVMQWWQLLVQSIHGIALHRMPPTTELESVTVLPHLVARLSKLTTYPLPCVVAAFISGKVTELEK